MDSPRVAEPSMLFVPGRGLATAGRLSFRLSLSLRKWPLWLSLVRVRRTRVRWMRVKDAVAARWNTLHHCTHLILPVARFLEHFLPRDCPKYDLNTRTLDSRMLYYLNAYLNTWLAECKKSSTNGDASPLRQAM